MKYRLLGKSGLRFSEAALGTMTFGDEWGWGSPKDEAQKVYETYREAGGNFLDTANFYTSGTSEKFVGEFTMDSPSITEPPLAKFLRIFPDVASSDSTVYWGSGYRSLPPGTGNNKVYAFSLSGSKDGGENSERRQK